MGLNNNGNGLKAWANKKIPEDCKEVKKISKNGNGHKNSDALGAKPQETKTLHYLVSIVYSAGEEYCAAKCTNYSEARGIGYGIYMGILHTDSAVQCTTGVRVTGARQSGEEYPIITFGIDAMPGDVEWEYIANRLPPT